SCGADLLRLGAAAPRPGVGFRPGAIAVLSAWGGTSSVKYTLCWSVGEEGMGCRLTLSSPPWPALPYPVPLARLTLAPYHIPKRAGDIGTSGLDLRAFSA